MSSQRGMRPLEVRLQGWAGRLSEGEQAARHLTRAMEVAREIARALPLGYGKAYLGAPERQALRTLFQRFHGQLVRPVNEMQG